MYNDVLTGFGKIMDVIGCFFFIYLKLRIVVLIGVWFFVFNRATGLGL